MNTNWGLVVAEIVAMTAPGSWRLLVGALQLQLHAGLSCAEHSQVRAVGASLVAEVHQAKHKPIRSPSVATRVSSQTSPASTQVQSVALLRHSQCTNNSTSSNQQTHRRTSNIKPSKKIWKIESDGSLPHPPTPVTRQGGWGVKSLACL